MRKINLIVVHCTATSAGRKVTAAEIDTWHKARGFKSIGYHFVVGLDGYIELGRPVGEPGAHAKWFNRYSIGVAYVGGLDGEGKAADTRTSEQKTALVRLLRHLKSRFPEARIVGHRDLAPKACPCFDAAKEYEEISGDTQAEA